MDMKMMMIIVDEQFRDNVEVVLEKHSVKGYSEIPMVLGEGQTGKKLGSRLHPGANSIVFSIVMAEKVERIKTDLIESCNTKDDQDSCSNEIHIAVLDVESFI